MNVLFRVAIVAIAVSAGWLYFQRMEAAGAGGRVRLLDERLAALLVRAVAPGSALSCLDELAGETVEAACEKAVFASPEAVSAAVAYVTAKWRCWSTATTMHGGAADLCVGTRAAPHGSRGRSLRHRRARARPAPRLYGGQMRCPALV